MACGAMVILVLTEMLGYAYYSTPLNPPDFKYLKTIRTLTSSSDSFNRIAWIGQHNKTSLTGGYDIAGYDSAAPRRYSEFLVIAQGESPDMVRQAIQIKRYHPLYEMLQCRYWISKQGDQLKVEEFPCRIPYSYFVRNYKVFSHRHDVFYEMIRSPFQAPKEVFLETLPVFGPVHKNSKTSVEFERISVNEIELKVKSKVPGILVISESYSKYWHAISLINPVKHAYSVEPANGAFCSIPLTAGDHHIAMTYLPSGFISGGYISMLAWTLFLMIIIGRKKHSKKL